MSKGSIVRAARKIVSTRWPEVDPSAACFYLSLAVLEVAKKEGIMLYLNAGSFSWRRVPAKFDDGILNTHFSYVWDQPSGDAAWEYVLSYGWLPEVHVWAIDPKRQQVVDLSIGTLPEACRRTTGEPWLTPKPPDFVWEHAREMPVDGNWRPDRSATEFVKELAHAIEAGNIVLGPMGDSMLEARLQSPGPRP